jgi:hypothetical protein
MKTSNFARFNCNWAGKLRWLTEMANEVEFMPKLSCITVYLLKMNYTLDTLLNLGDEYPRHDSLRFFLLLGKLMILKKLNVLSWKIRGFHDDDYEKWLLLGCYAV